MEDLKRDAECDGWSVNNAQWNSFFNLGTHLGLFCVGKYCEIPVIDPDLSIFF